MTRPVAVLRPQPGNSETVARLLAAGLTPIAMPLFEVRPVAWTAPDPAAHDALLLTSANAVRAGGEDLGRLVVLPVLAVGEATAAAARAAGLTVVMTGDAGAEALAKQAQAEGFGRVLHLGGRERHLAEGGAVTRAITVYASEPLEIARSQLAALEGTVTLVHSARAGRRIGALLDAATVGRGSVRLAAISTAAAVAAGQGWATVAAAPMPNDDALVALARRLAD
ncbi:MAG: uroporphyrinogen-III synthase [Sphingomonas sp.]